MGSGARAPGRPPGRPGGGRAAPRRAALLAGGWCCLAAARRADPGDPRPVQLLQGAAGGGGLPGPGRAGGTSSLAERGRGYPTSPSLHEAMRSFFPQIDQVVDNPDAKVGCDHKKEAEHKYPVKQQVRNLSSGATMKVIWPGCFARLRRNIDLDTDFAKSIRDFRPIDDALGWRTTATFQDLGEHFMSADGRFYMQEASAKALTLLQGPTFIFSYMKHLDDNPSTLLPHLVFAVLFEWQGWQSTGTRGLLITESSGRGFRTGEDSLLEFDLTGSSGQGGGRSRCSPLFPLGFWRRAPGEDDPRRPEGLPRARRMEGQDLDFYALRTQVGPKWIDRKEALLKQTPEHLQPFMHRIFVDYVEKTPISQSCLGGDAGKQWLQERGGFPKFCLELSESIKGLKAWENGSADGHAAKLKQAFRNVEGQACPLYARNDGTRLEGSTLDKWHEFIKQEKVAFDSVRKFFGYPAPNDENLTRAPLVVEPCMRSAVVRQLHIDVKFLVDHDITGYSMKLLIKHDPTAPAGTCDVKEDVEVRPLSKTQGRSVFERYQWGIRAKNASAGRAAERAIFKFKIENFLALGGHAVSGWAGFSSGEERVLNVQEIGASIRLPHVWKKLLDTPDMRRLKKCKNLVDSPEEAHRLGAMCWTGCGETSRTVCDELDDKAMDKAGTHFVKLVEYDFAGDWAKGHSLACDGFTNFGRHIRRALCGLTNRHPNYDDMESLGQRLKVDAIPEPFQSQIPGHEIERAFHANSLAGADSDLAVYLNFFLPTHKVPFVLKRLAVMTYYDFAQLPLPVDLLPSEEYARRLSRFVSAWVTSPSSKEWEDNMCPKLKRAGCLHIGGDHWQPDDPELTRVPEKPAFEDDDDDPSSGHRNSLGVLLGGALPALWFAAICSGPLWHAPA